MQEKTVHNFEKSQAPNTKLQINLKIQAPNTKQVCNLNFEIPSICHYVIPAQAGIHWSASRNTQIARLCN